MVSNLSKHNTDTEPDTLEDSAGNPDNVLSCTTGTKVGCPGDGAAGGPLGQVVKLSPYDICCPSCDRPLPVNPDPDPVFTLLDDRRVHRAL